MSHDTDKKITGSITPDGKVSFGESQYKDETPEPDSSWTPPPPAGIFGPLLTALDPKRELEGRFPMHVFSQRVHDAIKDIAYVKAINAKIPAGILLSMAGSAIGQTRGIRYKHGWESCGNLFVIYSAATGEGKSHIYKAIYGRMIERNQELRGIYTVERTQYEYDLRAWQLRQRKKDNKDMEDLEPKPPKKEQYLVDDATIEAVVDVLDDNRRGVTLLSNEMFSFFDSFDQYKKNGGGSKRKLLEGFDREHINIDRKNQNGISNSKSISNATISIFGCVQNGILSQLFTKTDRLLGLDARFLFVPSLEPFDGKKDREADLQGGTVALLAHITDVLLSLKMNQPPEGLERPHWIDVAPEAREVFNLFWDTVEEHTRKNEELSGFAQKMITITLRIALILHYLRYAETTQPQSETADTKMVIGAETMRNATLVATHFFWNLREVWNLLGHTDTLNTEAVSEFTKHQAMRKFIDGNPDMVKNGLKAAEFFDLGLSRDEFPSEKALREYLRMLQCPEKMNNGTRFYAAALIERQQDFGKPEPSAGKKIGGRAK